MSDDVMRLAQTLAELLGRVPEGVVLDIRMAARPSSYGRLTVVRVALEDNKKGRYRSAELLGELIEARSIDHLTDIIDMNVGALVEHTYEKFIAGIRDDAEREDLARSFSAPSFFEDMPACHATIKETNR